MIGRLLPFAGTLAVLAALAAPVHAQPTKLDPLARRALAGLRSGASIAALRSRELPVTRRGELDVFLVGTATRSELEAAGVRVRTWLPGVATAWVPPGAVARLEGMSAVRRIEGAARAHKNLDVSVPTTGASDQRGAGPLFAGMNGAGVLVGDVDTGIDYDHPDFQHPDGTTRLVKIWDQTDDVGPAPAGFAYGTEWSSSAIDADLARQIDEDGHGTHVMGIAAGDGSATGGSTPAHTYVGMAPQADLVMVKTTYQLTDVVDGVAWIMDLAQALGKNVVVNLSLGTLYGPKDNTSAVELAIDALVAPGRAVVVSAGNSASSGYHAEVVAAPGASAVARLTVLSSGADRFVGLGGYYPAGRSLTVTLRLPNGTLVGPLAPGTANASYPGTLTAAGYVYLENGLYTAPNGDPEVYAELWVPTPNSTNANMTGNWTLILSSTSSANHDETSEPMSGSGWNSAAGAPASPGTSSAFSGSHLVISEVGYRGINDTRADSTEFLEIYNPTGSTVDLSDYYLSDVNAYATLPVAGTINLSGINSDFAARFPAGATIGPGQAKVIAIDGGRWKRGFGADAAFQLFNAGGVTSAQTMIDVATNRGGAPGFGTLTNGGEFVWLFRWDGVSDLVCDVDNVRWGAPTGANAMTSKSGVCQDGGDADTLISCYASEGVASSYLALPASGSGTRQRAAAEGSESAGGNGCTLPGNPGPSSETDMWVWYEDVGAGFTIGAQEEELISEPATAESVITVAAYTTKPEWIDCSGRLNLYAGFSSPNGDIAWFSSPGPTRDGREKPDLAAPGLAVASSATHDIPVSCPDTYSEYLGDGLQHVVYAGTSMAAPHVSGAVALLFQKYGALPSGELKMRLNAQAKTDAFTGPVWNHYWGNGKLFVGDLTDPQVTVTYPNGGETATVGNHVNLAWSASDAAVGGGGTIANVQLEVSRDGGATWTAIGSTTAASPYDWTVTGPVTSQARIRAIVNDANQNTAADTSDANFAIADPTGVETGLPKAVALTLRSGNPSPGHAELEYALPRECAANLDVFDLGGRRVATLASGTRPGGVYRVRWSGSTQSDPSGVYFARLRAAGREIVKRFVLVR